MKSISSMDDEESSTSKKRKEHTEVDLLRETLNEAQKRITELCEVNSTLSQRLNDTVSQSDYKIQYLVKENDSLRQQLQELSKLHQECMKAAESSDSSEEEMESEAEIDANQSNGDGKVVENYSAACASRVTVPDRQRIQTPKNGKHGVESSSRSSDAVTRKSSKSVPVITAYNINIKDIMDALDKKLGHKNYSFKILGKNVTNIVVCTLDDYEIIKSLLGDLKVEYYTYTPKGRRPFTLVIEGLPNSFEASEVSEYLNGLQININILNVWKLGGDKWVVKITRDSDIRNFYAIRYVLHCKVSIRKFRKQGITQCFNCQRYGHVAMNCNMQYRCVKCGGSHGPGKCEIPPKGENTQENFVKDPVSGAVIRRVGVPVKCVNCGAEGHVASSKDCPRRLKLLRKLEEKKSAVGGSYDRAVNGRAEVKAGVSYATMARTASLAAGSGVSTPLGNVKGRNSGDPGLSLGDAMTQFSHIDRDCKRFFGGGLLQCLGRIRTFAREYRTLDNDEDRSRALLGMLISLSQDG